MPEPAATRILATTVEADGERAAYVEIALGDAASLEESRESIVISVRVEIDNRLSSLAKIQSRALHRAVELLREHSKPLDALMDQ